MQQEWTKEWPTDIAFETERHYWEILERDFPEEAEKRIFKIELADRLEKEWKAIRQRLTYTQLLEIFPEAAPIVKRETKRQIGALKIEQKELFQTTIEKRNSLRGCPPGDRWWIEGQVAALLEDQAKLAIRLKNRQWLIRKLQGAKDSPDHITHDDIAIAKQVPLTNFIEGRKASGKLVARCPFHTEKTGSFTMYQNNTWHCFGACGTGGDVIDFIMKKNDLKFLSAVRFLINK